MSLSQLAPEQVLRRLELQIVRRLEGFLHGDHFSLLPGPGSESAEARIYVPGSDDVRRIDWALSARTTIPHVRDVIADRELETWTLVDLSPSMHFGTAAMEKRDLAIAAVATMGLLTFRVGDRFGAYVLSQGMLRRLPARTGRPALYGLLRSLMRESASQSRLADPAPQSFGAAITSMSRTQRKRGLRVVVSDFIDPHDASSDVQATPSWERAMRELAERHQAIAVEIIDPRELDIPNVGYVLLQDPETGQVRQLNTADRKVRRRYAVGARLQRERTARALRRAGVAHLVLRTDRDWIADIARFALEHRRVARRAHRRSSRVRQ
ncbi:MAG: DUF58 domain-containing protein [Nocardioidaceae bacterium]|nr:DUF58 domain-containing protein [Nocardioidaceae bacterium]